MILQWLINNTSQSQVFFDLDKVIRVYIALNIATLEANEPVYFDTDIIEFSSYINLHTMISSLLKWAHNLIGTFGTGFICFHRGGFWCY